MLRSLFVVCAIIASTKAGWQNGWDEDHKLVCKHGAYINLTWVGRAEDAETFLLVGQGH